MPLMMIHQQRRPVQDKRTNEKTPTRKFSLNFKPYLDIYYKAVSNFTSPKGYGEISGISGVDTKNSVMEAIKNVGTLNTFYTE